MKQATLRSVANDNTRMMSVEAFAFMVAERPVTGPQEVAFVGDVSAAWFNPLARALPSVLHHLNTCDLDKLDVAQLLYVHGSGELRARMWELREVLNNIGAACTATGVALKVRLVAEFREADQIKTLKGLRDSIPLDDKRFEYLIGWLDKYRFNWKQGHDLLRACCRGPDGAPWLALGVAVLQLAVQKVLGDGVEFKLAVDGDGCLYSPTAATVVMYTVDLDASTLFPHTFLDGQRLFQLRRLHICDGSLFVELCNAAEVVGAMFARLLPQTTRLAENLAGAGLCWTNDLSTYPEPLRQVVTVAWFCLYSRTEFTLMLHWCRNLEGTGRNPAYATFLAALDAAFVREFAGPPMWRPDGFFQRVVGDLSQRRGLFRSWSDLQLRKNVLSSISESIGVALAISGRGGTGANLSVMFDLVSRMTGAKCAPHVDPAVTTWRDCPPSAELLERFNVAFVEARAAVVMMSFKAQEKSKAPRAPKGLTHHAVPPSWFHPNLFDVLQKSKRVLDKDKGDSKKKVQSKSKGAAAAAGPELEVDERDVAVPVAAVAAELKVEDVAKADLVQPPQPPAATWSLPAVQEAERVGAEPAGGPAARPDQPRGPLDIPPVQPQGAGRVLMLGVADAVGRAKVHQQKLLQLQEEELRTVNGREEQIRPSLREAIEFASGLTREMGEFKATAIQLREGGKIVELEQERDKCLEWLARFTTRVKVEERRWQNKVRRQRKRLEKKVAAARIEVEEVCLDVVAGVEPAEVAFKASVAQIVSTARADGKSEAAGALEEAAQVATEVLKDNLLASASAAVRQSCDIAAALVNAGVAGLPTVLKAVADEAVAVYKSMAARDVQTAWEGVAKTLAEARRMGDLWPVRRVVSKEITEAYKAFVVAANLAGAVVGVRKDVVAKESKQRAAEEKAATASGVGEEWKMANDFNVGLWNREVAEAEATLARVKEAKEAKLEEIVIKWGATARDVLGAAEVLRAAKENGRCLLTEDIWGDKRKTAAGHLQEAARRLVEARRVAKKAQKAAASVRVPVLQCVRGETAARSVNDQIRAAQRLQLPPLPKQEAEAEPVPKKKKQDKKPKLPTAATSKEAGKQRKREEKKAPVLKSDAVFGNAANELAKAAPSKRKLITRCFNIEAFRESEILRTTFATCHYLQIMEALLVDTVRRAPMWHKMTPVLHPVLCEVLCQAEVDDKARVTLFGAQDYVTTAGGDVVEGRRSVRLSADHGFSHDSFIFDCSKVQLEAFVTSVWSVVPVEQVRNALRFLQRAVRRRMCMRVARDAYLTQRRLLMNLLNLNGLRELAGDNWALIGTGGAVFDFLGVKDLRKKLEAELDDDGKEVKKEDEDVGEGEDTSEVGDCGDEASKLLKEFRTNGPTVAKTLAKYFVKTTLERRDPMVKVVVGHENDLRNALERFTLENWKAYYTESGHRVKVSNFFPNEAGCQNRFFSSDLIATTAALSKRYHEQPFFGQLRHVPVADYRTARHIFFDNTSLTKVMHLQNEPWFTAGREKLGDSTYAVSNKDGFAKEFEKAGKLLHKPKPVRDFGEFANVYGITTNGATVRIVGLQNPTEVRRRRPFLTKALFDEVVKRGAGPPKMEELVRLRWADEAAWTAHCMEKYGQKRPFSWRPNVDAPNGMPGRGLMTSKAACEIFGEDKEAGKVLLMAGNAGGLDFGQHHVYHLGLRCGSELSSLHGSGRQYCHLTKRKHHEELGRIWAASRLPEDQERLAANELFTERLRSKGLEHVGGAVPNECLSSTTLPSDFALKVDLDKAKEAEVVAYALALARRVRAHYDSRGRLENIVIVAGKETGSAARGQAVANRKRILDILSDHFLVVLYDENYSSQLHWKCGRPLEQYRTHEVRTKICYCCTNEREDGVPELVNRDFNAAVNILEWFCYELHYGQRPHAACCPKRENAPNQGVESSAKECESASLFTFLSRSDVSCQHARCCFCSLSNGVAPTSKSPALRQSAQGSGRLFSRQWQKWRGHGTTCRNHLGLLDEIAASDATLLSGVRLHPIATPLTDPDTLVSFPPDVVMFRRQAEYCQWQETKSNNQYTHTVTWSSNPINSAFFNVKSVEFRNPPVTPVEALQLHAPVRVEGREMTVKAKDVSGVLGQSTHRFAEGDYQQLQRSPAFQRGFVNMDGTYIILDYSRISQEHEFYKNLHRFSQFFATGEFYGSMRSLCTPGDIRVSYQVWRAPAGEVSLLGRQSSGEMVHWTSQKGHPVLFSRPGRLGVRELLDLEAGDVRWWRNVWRALFLVALVTAGVLARK